MDAASSASARTSAQKLALNGSSSRANGVRGIAIIML